MIVNGINDEVTVLNTVGISAADFDVSVLNTVGISGSVAIDGTVPVTGTVTVDSITETVGVSGSVDIGNTVNVAQTKTVAVSGDVTVDGTVDIGNTVTVTGSVDVDNVVNVAQTNTVAVSGDVGVTGTVDIGNTVTVTGSVDVDNIVNVAQTETVAVSAAADSLPVQVTNQPTVGLTSGNTISLVTSAGVPIDVHLDGEGEPHLGVSMIQTIITSQGNFSTANLSAGEIYYGTAEETLGISTIQFFVSSNVNTRITIQQGVEPSFSSDVIEDYWDVLPNTPFASFVSSISPYCRLKVTNTDTVASSAFVCAMGLTPIFSVLPRALSDDNRLKVETTIAGQQNNDRHAFIAPLNSININTNVRLVGTVFTGTTKDTAFWTEETSGSGSVVQGGGEVELFTGTTANSRAAYYTSNLARYTVSRPLRMIGYFSLETAPVANNVRRIGAYNSDSGFFFQVNGTAFSIGTRRSAVDTLITNGTFNGNYGLFWNPSVDTYYKLEIEYGNHGANWYIDGKLLHSLGPGHWTNTNTLPAYMENFNYGGQTIDSSFDCLGLTILGQGEFITNPAYKYLAGATSQLLKVGAGVFHRIMNNENSGNITVYDGLDATGRIICQIDLAKVLGPLEFQAPFDNGLYIVQTGAGAKITLIYE